MNIMKRNFTIKLLLFALVLIIPPQFFSCKKIDIKREVLLRTMPAENITYEAAVLKGDVIDAGEDGSVIEYGFVYSMSGNPTVSDIKAILGTANPLVGSVSKQVSYLESNKTFYFKLYAIEKEGKITYGNVNSFQTDINPGATVPVVVTQQASEISPISAKVSGIVMNDGGASVTRRGFCISTEPMPNVNDDPFTENGTGEGEFMYIFTNLIPITDYYVRAYAENELGIGYGGEINFTTEESGGVVSSWLYYDDGVNVDGIGLNDGGNFDVAIRFTPDQLAQYNGFKITKIKFFPKVGSPVEYFLEIFTGENPSLEDQVYDQYVENPEIDTWNDVTLEIPYIIDASQELWVGYYVTNQEASTYPAGIDNGPGEVGFGDMISVDNLNNWLTLADAGIDANWNIQIFVTNEAGIEMPMTRNVLQKPARMPAGSITSKSISSQNSNR